MTWFPLDRIYLHGIIENTAGFDLLVTPTQGEAPLGIYPVVVDISGKTYGCTAYVWPDKDRSIGLVVLNTDKPANEYAYAKFHDQSARI